MCLLKALCVKQSEVWMVGQWLVKHYHCHFSDSQYLRGSTGQSHREVKESNNKQGTHKYEDKATLI